MRLQSSTCAAPHAVGMHMQVCMQVVHDTYTYCCCCNFMYIFIYLLLLFVY